MVSTGPSDINGASQPMPASLMRSSSGFLGTQNGVAMPSQSAFPSHLSPRTQFNNSNMIGNVLNVSSPNQSFGHGGTNVGPGDIHRLVNDNGTQTGPNSCNGIAFNSQPSFGQSNMINSISSGQMNSLQNLNPLDRQSRQLDHRNFQLNQQQSQQNQNNFSTVKLEPQQIQQAMRTFKMDPPQQTDQQSLFLQQQQQQQMLQLSRSSSQGPTNLLHQQRLLQYQQQQQQIALRSLPLQRSPSQHPAFQPQILPLRPSQKPAYEPGMCARRLTRYMYEQQHRPEDNDIVFWRKFVAEFFAPNAKKKWCVSMYGSGRQTTGIFPQDVWQCEICNHKPGRGFEATAEVLPRLFKIKYESGTLEELLYIDMPREYQNSAGQIVLDYAKAIQQSVFDQLRVVRDGQLRIVFSPELKICSWEFCARRHEELIPRRLLMPQVSQVGSAAQKYQASTQSQNASSNLSVDLQNNCNTFVASAKQVVKALEVPLVNDLGYSKRYVRCLQIAEVVNSMKDLIDYGKQTSMGPMESLVKFPRRANTQFVDEQQSRLQQPQLQTTLENLSHDQTTQAPSTNGALTSADHSLPSPPSTSSANAIANLLRQNSMNSRSQYPITNNANSLFLQAPRPTSSSNALQNSPNISIQQQGLPRDDSQSSVQKTINQMITNTQSGIGNNGNDVRSSNRVINITNGTGITNMVRGSIGNNGMTMNGRIGTSHQQGLGFGSINGYNNNLQFDWKPSP